MLRSAPLSPGARVALVAPAGPLHPEAVERAVERVIAWGWEPLLGEHARARHGYLAGADEQRAADINQALLSEQVDAIWCLRGGYGTMRILDRVRWEALVRRPRPLIGFSDNTALHLALHRRGVVSFHGPHPGTEEFPPFSQECLRRLLCNPAPAGLLPFPARGPARAETVVPGSAEGPLVGGNLSLVASTLGTPYAVQAEGAILFLEEVGEPAYRVDRLLSHLRLAGVFDRVAGVAIGAFSDAPDHGAEGIPSAEEVIRERLAGLRVPVAMHFPFGHVAATWTLPLGIRARLDATAGTLALLEPALAS